MGFVNMIGPKDIQRRHTDFYNVILCNGYNTQLVLTLALGRNE